MKNFLEITLAIIETECAAESNMSDFHESEKEVKKSVLQELSQARIKFCDFCKEVNSLEEVKECAALISKMRKVIDARFEYEAD